MHQFNRCRSDPRVECRSVTGMRKGGFIAGDMARISQSAFDSRGSMFNQEVRIYPESQRTLKQLHAKFPGWHRQTGISRDIMQ